MTNEEVYEYFRGAGNKRFNISGKVSVIDKKIFITNALVSNEVDEFKFKAVGLEIPKYMKVIDGADMGFLTVVKSTSLDGGGNIQIIFLSVDLITMEDKCPVYKSCRSKGMPACSERCTSFLKMTMSPAPPAIGELSEVEYERDFPKAEKPPLGLIPLSNWEEGCNSSRIEEIIDAMTRFSEVEKPIPLDWISELYGRIKRK